MELIVFDLDGTLLNDASQISPFTHATLALLAKKEIAYTLATGRTLHSAQAIIDGHGFHLPHIYSNGVITWNPQNESLSLENLLTVTEANSILESALLQDITPFISSVDFNNRYCIYHPKIRHAVEKQLCNTFSTRPDVAILPVDKMPANAQITNISMLGAGHKIDAIQQNINTETQLIAYSGPALEGKGLKWIDIHHSHANKGSAIEGLKKTLGISKLICFGDSDNDLSMFAVADECYAPANANAEIKAAATAIVGHHDADGVAYFLRERFNL